jgi:hypothetical protein
VIRVVNDTGETKLINTIDKAGHRGWLLSLASVTSLALLALAGPVVAADEAPKTGPEETVIIKVIQRGKDGRTAENNALPDGAPVKMLGKCSAGKKFESDTETKGANGEVRRTRIVLCPHGEHDQKSTLQGLESARKRIAEDPNLTIEQRDKVLATLDQEIARAKGAQTQTP